MDEEEQEEEEELLSGIIMKVKSKGATANSTASDNTVIFQH